MMQCAAHGECLETFVCTHLLGETAGLRFNRNEPTTENPFSNAWCDNCELIRAAHKGWNEQSEKLAKLSLLCSAFYDRARLRNTRTSVTLDDLADLRWECGTCEEWHTGPRLDFCYHSPYWSREHKKASDRAGLLPSWSKNRRKTFLDGSTRTIDTITGKLTRLLIFSGSNSGNLRKGIFSPCAHRKFQREIWRGCQRLLKIQIA